MKEQNIYIAFLKFKKLLAIERKDISQLYIFALFPPIVKYTPSIYHNIHPDTTVWLRIYDYKLELLKIEERYYNRQMAVSFLFPHLTTNMD